ncbi:zinc finger protein 41-like isoform X2 [Portunus trituberculatus]|uniref:zinc finger protein 41-like isoform X2 n=1 Tax=Portunus trituberculatus TaxID=210409 RepID=UPI001E1CECFE|nr:zinc finger protein 41-like isoform X2 [Portunus trituberculatus]
MGYLACPVCERESLANVSDLQLRVATALTRPLTCPICSASVSGLQAFHHHLGAHLHPQHNACSSPGTPPVAPGTIYPPVSSPENIPNLENLDISDGGGCGSSPARLQSEAAGEKPSSTDCSVSQAHNCDLCGLVFSSEHFLKIHKDIIHSKKCCFDVTCKLCRKKFKDFETYRNHVREEHSERRYMCEHCPKTFKMKGSLLVHTRMFHDPSSPGTCHVCNKTFTTRARRELHEKRYHSHHTEHLNHGKASPHSTLNKSPKTKTSSLGDAKNWLETLMNENKTAGEEAVSPSEAAAHQHHHVPHQSPPPPPSPVSPYTSHPTKQQQHQQQHQQHHHHQHQQQPDISMIPENHSGQHFISQQSNPSPQQRTEQGEVKEYHYHHQQQLRHIQQATFETHIHPAKLSAKEPEGQHAWGQEVQVQSYVTLQEKGLPQQKSQSDFYFAPYKTNIVFPCQMLQQNLGRSRIIEYSEMKEEKKVPIPPYSAASENTSSNRVVGNSHTQSSPVAVVSPQPHKAETPPTDNMDVVQPHTETRRTSLPHTVQANFNKLQSPPQNETTTRQTSTSYASELPVNTPGGTSAGGSVNSANLSLVYQNIMPNLTPQTIIDHKSGIRVPPQLMPANLCQTDKKGQTVDSSVQVTETQKGVSTCEVRPLVTEGQQERTRPNPAPPPVTKKDGRGSESNKQWECDVCKKSFTTKYFLKKHKRLHTGETPYACAECGKTFTFQQSYHKHVLYHSDDKPHRCSYCGRSFKEMSTLHNHVRIHTGEKPFVCETCGKAFRQRVSYLVHQRIHTGVMPYTCEVCHRSFRYKVEMVPAGCVGGLQDPSHGSPRCRPPLETIDAAAISCEGTTPHEEKRAPHRSRGGRGGGGAQDPLSMAFLHALVDPQPGRPQPQQDPSLPFPSLSPGAIDADMDHDSFLTNLLM